jgi:hypothetical protein
MNIFHSNPNMFADDTVATRNCGCSPEEVGMVIVGTNQKAYAIWQHLMKSYSHFNCNISKAGYCDDLTQIAELSGQEGSSLILSSESYSPEQLSNDAALSIITNRIDPSLISDKDLDALSLIGIQKHLCPLDTYHQCMDSMFNLLRLSDLRRDINLCEVVLRESSHVVFDLASIRKSDFPIDQKNASICGMTLEEACQLMKFIGSIQTLKTLEITSIDYAQSSDNSYYELISLLVWYFMEGTNFRNQNSSISHKKQYIVYPEGIELPLYFYNESMTDKWWVNTNDEMEQLIACSPKDFEDVRNGFLSERMMKIVDRLS